jgi:hypothetical protein
MDTLIVPLGSFEVPDFFNMRHIVGKEVAIVGMFVIFWYGTILLSKYFLSIERWDAHLALCSQGSTQKK